MNAGWVAGTVRARAMARRRVGRTGVRALAASASLDDAVDVLAAGPYGHDVRRGQSLAEAQHAVAATLLWNARVLSGWLPREGATLLRVLAGWFELANVDERLRTVAGRPAADAFALGALAVADRRLAGCGSIAEVRAVLATSPWGDPGDDTSRAVQAGMRLSWAERVAAAVPPAAPWALGGAALLVAREHLLAGRRLPPGAMSSARRLLGTAARDAASLPELAAAAGRRAGWVLAGVEEPGGLWRAEAAWWQRVGSDASGLLRGTRFGPEAVVGALAVGAVDAWRVQAALEVADRGGRGGEAFDAVA